ncbi:hypothetical protein [Silvimonas sp.]|uniref:hypothetical protein n=1 Tax=Silvimonas sp. TaxID=2650811 RepID=UPI00284E80E1|nr:hypothetical protein [Silvimonas sp.]MDR3427750.1 hypothetical protein [Silvimonas sp.]
MPKHFFAQTSFQSPFSTILINELRAALIDKRLGGKRPSQKPRLGRAPFSNQLVSVKSPKDKIICLAEVWRKEHMLADLQTGVLIAHALNENTENFRTIPTSYWHEDFAANTLNGYLHDNPISPFISEGLKNAPVCILDHEAKTWLNKYGITEIDSEFPDQLRSKTERTRKSRRKKYNWPQFENKALDYLMDEGGLRPDWLQAHLERAMLAWCRDHWPEEPSARLARDHVKAAISRFHAEKKLIGLGTLGN